ncbi:MAG: Hpt domain-containing protein [Anaerolineaceae bacterium]|nr:Hpt domain-containing protein [Anaerolineaceae bacterium]
MTLEELYKEIGGNYEQAQRVMKMDKLIDRYIKKLKSSGVGERLSAAADAMDPAMLFESAHAMKGVCANLGLDSLASAAEEICEEFRPGKERKFSDDEVREKTAEIRKMFDKTIEGIAKYEAGA